jgi:hypothetical protein
MATEVVIPDSELVGFTEPAKEKLLAVGDDYLKFVISEANRLEADRNIGGGPPEVTQSMVADAASNYRYTPASRKKQWPRKLVSLGSAIASLIAGFMFDFEALKEPTYLVGFIVVLTFVIALNTAQIFMD